jgi:hypothetical protein
MIWKVEAQGDTVYIEAETLDEAEERFKYAFGYVPKHLVTWTIIEELPEGEETI